ncbi:MAG: PEP/pyruvate-binding domain-containing protein [Actinomycetota bacterium]
MKNIKYTELLQDVSQKDFSRVGGKGANLGEMIKAGLPVPEGFVLLADSYKRFMTANNLNTEIDNMLIGVDNDNQEKLEEASVKIRKLFEQSEIPHDVLIEIDRIYEQIGSPEAAVRSSATAEDLPGTSFAGQYDTFLNVKGKDELYKCVKKCWASLWSARALSYRIKQNIDNTGLAHGVVIQKLINAEKSGILFTANPVNGRRDQILLNSSWGLGEAIVGGDVTPDQWIVDKKNRYIVEENIATKEIMTVRKEAGTEFVDVPEKKRKQATLSQEEVLKLLELGEKTEDHFGFPQDIEWAFYEGVFYLVQTRPITSLYPIPEPEDVGKGLRIYVNFLMNKQATPEPLTPIGEDMIKKAFTGIIFNRKARKKPFSRLKSVAGRLFVDVTELYRFERWWDKLANNPTDMDPVTTRALLQVLERNKAELLKQRKSLIKSVLRLLVKMNPWLPIFMITSIPKVIYGAVFPPDRAVAKAFEYGNNQIKSIMQKREKLQTRQEKLEFIERQFTAFFYYVPLGVLYYVTMSLVYIEKAKKIMSKHMDDTSELNKVEKAVSHNVTTEMGMGLLQIAKNLNRAGVHPTLDNPEVKQFLAKYGHRSSQEVDLGVPGWKENPGYIINLIQSYINNKSYNEGIEKFYRDMEEADQAIENITRQLKEKSARRDARRVEILLKKFRKTFGVRELPKYILTKAFSILREILMEIGEELQAEDRLDHKTDIFLVSFEDIRSGEKLQKLVRQNREEYQRELQKSLVPRVMTSTGETIFSVIEDERNDTYKGIPVSPGVYEGPVKVLKHPEEGSRLKKGDILVTTATNPAWTPLFLIIGGLIMETGGPMSHGSVVAREYGVPAVAGVREATARLKDRQKVRLNGETGKVEILSPE